MPSVTEWLRGLSARQRENAWPWGDKYTEPPLGQVVQNKVRPTQPQRKNSIFLSALDDENMPIEQREGLRNMGHTDRRIWLEGLKRAQGGS